MLCYTGKDFTRIYLSKKSKKLAWKASRSDMHWVCDLSDLRRVYDDLFDKWDDESRWEEAECFSDSHY